MAWPAFVAAVALLAGCGSSNDSEPSGDPGAPAAPGSTPGAGDDSAAPPSDGSGQGSGDGSLTLTIGDETWEFDNLLCVTGLEANESDIYTFVGYATGESEDGKRLDFFAEISDASGAGLMEGDGVISYIELIIYQDADLATGFVAETNLGWDNNTAVVTAGGGTVTGTGDFIADEEYAFGAPSTPGSFSGNCGSSSIG